MRRNSTVVAACVVVALATGAAAIAGMRLRGEEAARAATAAIEASRGSWAVPQPAYNGAWAFKVTRSDGSVADVTLDHRLHVTSIREHPVAAQVVNRAAVQHRLAANDGGQRDAANDRDEPADTDDRERNGSADDDREEAVPASDSERAAQAALRATGGGKVQDVDRDAEGDATWEVEITTPEGKNVDVLLDKDFHVLSVGGEQEANEGRDDDEGGRDDD